MKYRLLGHNTGLAVSQFVLGTARMGKMHNGKSDPAEALQILHHFADAGGNFIDTSSAYQGGIAEQLVGEFLNPSKRDDFVIASKYCRTPLSTPARAAHGNHRKAMRAEVEGSLKRLKTDHIDVYFVHFDDGITPIDEIMRGLDDLVRAGKILYIGLSNMPVWRMASASMMAQWRGLSPVSVMQMQYNLLERTIEREFIPFAQATGMAVMAWSPLFGGVLAKETAENPEYADALFVLGQIADRLQKSRAEIALAWLLAKNTLPVLGPRTLDQLSGGLTAGDIVLSDDDITALEQAFAFVAGYPYDLLSATRHAAGYDGLGDNHYAVL
ncbi:aldo/keto reductase [Thalassospira mesophila]|uniref:aldo/keto reductase n=1 Tax=Thalassospira mesophila TaxID=1293891 RepID=UPI000A1EA182|nr:aldo/keto reductase [Thalassospira mesophila]